MQNNDTSKNPVHILVLNSGSSSFKFSVYVKDGFEVIIHGAATSLNSAEAVLEFQTDREQDHQALQQNDHQGAIERLLTILERYGVTQRSLRMVGHRVVHGGEHFQQSIVVDDHRLQQIERCNELAPLHNPANVLGIRLLRSAYPHAQQVAVFDTAFHQTLAAKAYLYALPMQFYRDHHVRRYGFHGTSHRYVARQCCQMLNLNERDHQLLIAHLGNGCSATAVVNGKSVDTTMGLTPLEGLVMGTRSGDLDPGLHAYLERKTGWSLGRITEMLNKNSGLLGLSELSNDMRELSQAADDGNEQAALAIEVFCFKAARLLGGLAMSLKRIDALVFTAGIGENAPGVRAKIVAGLGILNFQLDPRANESHPRRQQGMISSTDSLPVVVIPTDEERQIALDCLALMESE